MRRSRYLGPLIEGVRSYGRAKARGREGEARKIARDFCLSFPAIVEWLLVEDPSPDEIPSGMREGLGDVRRVKRRFPEIVRDAFGTDG